MEMSRENAFVFFKMETLNLFSLVLLSEKDCVFQNRLCYSSRVDTDTLDQQNNIALQTNE